MKGVKKIFNSDLDKLLIIKDKWSKFNNFIDIYIINSQTLNKTISYTMIESSN